MSTLAAHGIEVQTPAGWDGRISLRPTGPQPGAEHPVAHLASFALPSQCGDFGSGAVERMTARDVLICLLEFDQPEAGSALFARRTVPRLRPSDFAPNSMQRTIPGMCGTQVFFTAAGRAMCLYVVLGSFRSRASLVPAVNGVLAGLRITRRA